MNEERKGGQGRGDSANSKLQIESAAFELFEEFSKLTSKVAEAGPELRQSRPCCRNVFFFWFALGSAEVHLETSLQLNRDS